MDQVSLRSRYLGGYIYYAQEQKTTCESRLESRQPSTAPYAHSERGSKRLLVLQTVLVFWQKLILALIFWYLAQSSPKIQQVYILDKSQNVIMPSASGCLADDVVTTKQRRH
jgi:hypothetical protein